MSDQSSAARVAGKNFRTFTYQGLTYLLSEPLTMGSYAEEESVVLWKRRDPGEFAVKMLNRLPLNYHQGVLNASAAANNGGIPTEEEWDAYGKSMWKKAYMLWTCLAPRHKQDPKTGQKLELFDGLHWAMKILYAAQTFDETQAMIGQPATKLNEIMLKCHIVSQEQAIKNFAGPTDQDLGGPETQSEKPSPSEAGLGYSNSSPGNTAG